MGWREETADLVSDCVEAFGEPEVYTLSRTVAGQFSHATGTREGESYSQEITLIESRIDQSLRGQYGGEAVAYRGKMADLEGGLGPEPRLAEGMYVTDSDGVRRRVVMVDFEAARQGFVLVCVMDRRPAAA